ncbi:hypothetical protein ZIOFF_047647 [Zingiber officinale]|uniref:Uncharacterized protein n=1 Tax=Zingiber officinale TaxID=94328 RepID=A0A8J5FV96_ZINOF|nr:hypothetical protein ZIOFF_047647 [Zingiber officinale]
MAARLEYPRSKKPFRSYALLGDDIVISDERVALRLCGAGYRVRSRLAKPSKKQKDGKGCLIVEKVLSRMKPKQLELVPDEYYDVSISEAKSLQSQMGALEFAKQLWVNRVQVNLTPVSAKALLGATTLIGLCQLAEKYGLSRTSLFSLAGAGYRVHEHHLSRQWKRLRADKSLTYLRLPLDLWLNPTNPYLKGIIVEKVRRVSQAIGLIPR